MALKDHITDSAKLSEAEIEAIVGGLLKYDPTSQAVVFLPKAQELSAEKKILLYLVALRGWKFVIEKNPPAADASPKEIERTTGIKGGTLRPILRDLSASKILDSRKGKYEIPAHNLSLVREAMSGGKIIVTSKGVAPRDKKKKKQKSTESKKPSRAGKPSLTEAFNKTLETGWFKGGKTLSELKEKLEEAGVIVPMSRLPVHLLGAIRAKPPRLARHKDEREGKKVWVYAQKTDRE